MDGLTNDDPDCSEFVEVDPTGRYGRYNEILGKGASKTVYRAFDEFEGIEVAWNQVKLYDFLQSPEDLERLYCEIHLLKTLKHDNIMKFYTSWVDTANRNINFVTEMFTSGTLRQYRLRHKRVNIRAVKHWCRQILKGLNYLHSHDPPVIHRDLKCDNIFVNGNQGEVKIGDLGLAAILRKSHAAHCVGTPEFMAPEVYEEAYNELVDIYSFGMCILEMVTFEYPYSECTHPAQIYKKVISGKKPDALYKVKDPEVRRFVDKCLATVSRRLSARELLNDPFLQTDKLESDLRLLYSERESDIGPIMNQPYLEYNNSNISFNGRSNCFDFDDNNEWGYQPVETESSGIELFEHHDDEHSADVGISIKGKTGEDGDIFLRLRIADKEGRIRNIHFPFDTQADTALSVATEMVAELDITDQDVVKIADMIDGEISLLVPKWIPGPGIEETPHFANQGLCHNCASNHTSNGSLMGYFLSKVGNNNIQCCMQGCASMHGRFEEITYQAEEYEQQRASNAPSQSNGLQQYQKTCDQHESRELSSIGSEQSHSDEEEYEKLHGGVLEERNESDARNFAYNLADGVSFPSTPSICCNPSDNYENEIQQELRWLKAKYRMELREIRDKQWRLGSRSTNSLTKELTSLVLSPLEGVEHNHFHSNEDVVTAKSFYSNLLLPHCLHRTTSLPVDAVDI